VEKFTVKKVRHAIHLTKNGKATKPSEVESDMLKCFGEAGVRWITDLCNTIVREARGGLFRRIGERAGC